MEKKNKYVITIGFNKSDEDHRSVAMLLNDKNRTKAQYIVKAVLAYEKSFQGKERISGNVINADEIKEYIHRAVEDYMNGAVAVPSEMRDAEGLLSRKTEEKQMETEIQEEALESILKSLSSFRNG